MIIHKRRGKGVIFKRVNIRCGEGIGDFIKPVMGIINGVIQHKDLLAKSVNAAKDIYSIGKDVKQISSKSRQKHEEAETTPEISNEVKGIINKIRELQVIAKGEGFCYA